MPLQMRSERKMHVSVSFGRNSEDLLIRKKQRDNLKIVHEIEENEGKGWIDKILQANGLKRRKEVDHG